MGPSHPSETPTHTVTHGERRNLDKEIAKDSVEHGCNEIKILLLFVLFWGHSQGSSAAPKDRSGALMCRARL